MNDHDYLSRRNAELARLQNALRKANDRGEFETAAKLRERYNDVRSGRVLPFREGTPVNDDTREFIRSNHVVRVDAPRQQS